MKRDGAKLYNDYTSYLKSRYGTRVYRIGIDAGFTCPNRDGTKGSGGCAYCNADGSRAVYAVPTESVREQITSSIARLKEKDPAAKFIAYFQAFTNTYAPVARLKAVYDEVLPFKDVVGIAIGTRPDTIDWEKLAFIASYRDRYEVWVEYGMQSSHDRTLRLINRGHTYKDLRHAVRLTKESGVAVSLHVILGLPGETRADMIATANAINAMGVDGIKIHLMHVLKGSAFETLYREGRLPVLTQDAYVDLACDFLENLESDILIQRLTGEGTEETHLAPLWALDKMGTIRKIRERLGERGSFQGKNCRKVT